MLHHSVWRIRNRWRQFCRRMLIWIQNFQFENNKFSCLRLNYHIFFRFFVSFVVFVVVRISRAIYFSRSFSPSFSTSSFSTLLFRLFYIRIRFRLILKYAFCAQKFTISLPFRLLFSPAQCFVYLHLSDADQNKLLRDKNVFKMCSAVSKDLCLFLM